MARCPKKGDGKGGSSSSAPPGFAAYAGVDENEGHATFLTRDKVAGTEHGDRSLDSPMPTGTEHGDRSKRVSFPTTGTEHGDGQWGSASGAPRPPWEDA